MLKKGDFLFEFPSIYQSIDFILVDGIKYFRNMPFIEMTLKKGIESSISHKEWEDLKKLQNLVQNQWDEFKEDFFEKLNKFELIDEIYKENNRSVYLYARYQKWPNK